jgi:hypothetical protein
MASTYLQGIPRPVDLAAALLDSDLAISREWSINRNPLYARLRAAPVDSFVVQTWPHQFRPRTTTLGAAVADAVTTTITLASVAFIMNGDVLMLASGEFVEVVDHPNTTANTILVRRGAAGTTAAAQTTATTVTLIGNSRTSAETQQKAITELPGNVVQYVQTFQHVFSLGGGQLAVRPRYLAGRATPYDGEKQDKLQNITDDIEFAAMYGRAENVGGAVSRYKMGGLFNLLTTNNTTGPTNAAAYKPSDFIRDTFQPIVSAGGNPDLILASTGWLTGLSVWGFQPQRIDAGSTVFGTSINAFAVPFFPQATIIPVPMMQGNSAIVCESDELQWGVLEQLRSQDYGITGDAREGDWIARQAIVVENEQHHAAVRNITGFAPQS